MVHGLASVFIFLFSEDLFSPLQNMCVCPEEESVLMSSFVSTLSALSIKQGDYQTMITFPLEHFTLFKTKNLI